MKIIEAIIQYKAYYTNQDWVAQEEKLWGQIASSNHPFDDLKRLYPHSRNIKNLCIVYTHIRL